MQIFGVFVVVTAAVTDGVTALTDAMVVNRLGNVAGKFSLEQRNNPLPSPIPDPHICPHPTTICHIPMLTLAHRKVLSLIIKRLLILCIL